LKVFTNSKNKSKPNNNLFFRKFTKINIEKKKKRKEKKTALAKFYWVFEHF